MDETEATVEKLQLLTIDKLIMAEIRVFEKMSGYTVEEVYRLGNGAMPSAVVMALAYLTEKRKRPSVKQERYEQLSYHALISLLEQNFTFETVEDTEAEDPTEAA